MKSINDLVIVESIEELQTPGVICAVSPLQADELGAFEEVALTEAEALESTIDMPEEK